MGTKTTVTIPADLSLDIDEEVIAQKRATGRSNVTKQEIVVAAIRAYLAELKATREQRVLSQDVEGGASEGNGQAPQVVGVP